jgi:hypothetical protein
MRVFILLFLTACAHMQSSPPAARGITSVEPTEHLAARLPDLTGIPADDEQAAQNVAADVRSAAGGDEASCAKIDPRLRAMVFRHYENLQMVANRRGQYFTSLEATTAAHITNMILHESSGNSCDVTDMKGDEVNTYKPVTNLKCWESLFSSAKVQYNDQTNYGLAQQSPDRAEVSLAVNKIVASHLPSDVEPTTKAGTFELFHIYQQFAQGREQEGDQPIPQSAAELPENQARLKRGIQAALWHCGTRYLFEEGYQNAAGQAALEGAMQTIAYCDIGSGGTLNSDQQKCFARWLTLCAALNIDIAALNPLSYFQTRGVQPVCATTFAKLTIAAPVGH